MCEHKRLFAKWSKYLDEVRRLGGFTADLCCECGRVVRVRVVAMQLTIYGAFDWPKPAARRVRVTKQAASKSLPYTLRPSRRSVRAATGWPSSAKRGPFTG